MGDLLLILNRTTINLIILTVSGYKAIDILGYLVISECGNLWYSSSVMNGINGDNNLNPVSKQQNNIF